MATSYYPPTLHASDMLEHVPIMLHRQNRMIRRKSGFALFYSGTTTTTLPTKIMIIALHKRKKYKFYLTNDHIDHCSAVPFQITRVRASCVFALLTEVQTPHFYAEMNVFSLFILYSDIKGLDMIYSCQNWKEKYVKCGFQEVFNITTRHLILKCMFAKSKYAFILYHGFLSVEKKFVKLASISWVALFLRFLGKLSILDGFLLMASECGKANGQREMSIPTDGLSSNTDHIT